MSEQELNEYICLYRNTVYRLAYSYMKNCEDAEDISQEAFIKLYLSKESFASCDNVKAWLIRVTVNLCKNLLKAAWRRSREELLSEPCAPMAEQDDISQYIDRLKPAYSAVLYLFYYEGYSVKEIAQICGVSPVVVRVRLSRGRNSLKEMLLKENEL